jgi:type I restriction-modification system DNA methylase subunit
MSYIEDNIERKILRELDTCVRGIGGYNFHSLMPLFYVLVAHHQGYTVMEKEDTIDITEDNPSALLLDIQLAFRSKNIDRHTKAMILEFYYANRREIDNYYRAIIGYIIAYCSNLGGKSSSIASTPHKVATLISQLASDCHPTTIYDPCAGLCTYLLENNLADVSFVGQEINYITKVVAEIRLDARINYSLYNEN